jgi:integrase
MLKKWLIWLAGRKAIRHKKDGTTVEGQVLSGRRANAVIQAMRVAIRWAVDNEEIPIDPFRKLGEVAESMREKGILTLEERNTLIAVPVADYRTRLVMLLGCLCTMRRGEMRGFQWGDIEGGIITIQHNYQDKDGLKLPKYNSIRKVPIPMAVQSLLDTARKFASTTSPDNPDITLDPAPDCFVLESPLNPGKPLCNNFFRTAVDNELAAIGISIEQQEERNLTPHSLRHTFVTLAQIAGIPDVEIRALTGQKSAAVMNKYSHVPQVINFEEARRKIDASANVLQGQKAVNS